MVLATSLLKLKSIKLSEKSQEKNKTDQLWVASPIYDATLGLHNSSSVTTLEVLVYEVVSETRAGGPLQKRSGFDSGSKCFLNLLCISLTLECPV